MFDEILRLMRVRSQYRAFWFVNLFSLISRNSTWLFAKNSKGSRASLWCALPSHVVSYGLGQILCYVCMRALAGLENFVWKHKRACLSHRMSDLHRDATIDRSSNKTRRCKLICLSICTALHCSYVCVRARVCWRIGERINKRDENVPSDSIPVIWILARSLSATASPKVKIRSFKPLAYARRSHLRGIFAATDYLDNQPLSEQAGFAGTPKSHFPCTLSEIRTSVIREIWWPCLSHYYSYEEQKTTKSNVSWILKKYFRFYNFAWLRFKCSSPG